MNKQTKKYYRTIYRLFPIQGKAEKRYLQYIKNYLEEYEINHQQTQYNDLVEYFGQPQDIVSAYYEHFESEYIISHMKTRHFIKYIMIIFISCTVIISIYLLWTRHKIYQDYLDSRAEYEETIIIKETSN